MATWSIDFGGEPEEERGSQVSGAPEAAIEASLAAIRAASSKPHGIFSVDTSGDDAGVPKVTEINVGRFTSVGRHLLVLAGIQLRGNGAETGL